MRSPGLIKLRQILQTGSLLACCRKSGRCLQAGYCDRKPQFRHTALIPGWKDNVFEDFDARLLTDVAHLTVDAAANSEFILRRNLSLLFGSESEF